MRRKAQTGGVTIQAIAGNHAVFFGLNLDTSRRKNCLGFAIHRTDHTEGEQYWLSGFKTFRSVVPFPHPETIYPSLLHPVQSFYWGDYTVKPKHRYTYRVVPRYGDPKDLVSKAGVEATVELSTGDPDEGTHGIYFNRGVAASQAYARRFGNTPRNLPPDLRNEALEWLSRGLREALLKFIGKARSPKYALRAAVYQFSDLAVLEAFRKAHQEGADVKIVYHGTGGEGATSSKAIDKVHIRSLVKARTRAPIGHNKFVVLCRRHGDGTLHPFAVWTGSTNMSEGGIFGHSNVGHVVRDPSIATRYLEYWDRLWDDPEPATLRDWANTRDPFSEPKVAADPGTQVFFSPRTGLGPLDWYASRFGTEAFTGITVPFGLAKQFEEALSTSGNVLRFVLLNRRDNNQDAWASSRRIVIAVGSLGGPDSLDRWAKETLTGLNRHALYIHTKVLLVDPLSADPTIITGSANFSEASTNRNDENMLVIRGDLDVADVYFTEYARLFNHFYARYWAAQLRSGDTDDGNVQSFLREDDRWQRPYFTPGNQKYLQRRAYALSVQGNT